jgi:hypothetical protein
MDLHQKSFLLQPEFVAPVNSFASRHISKYALSLGTTNMHKQITNFINERIIGINP